MRTTTAVTMIDGGVKENVLPSRASAVVNFRILPGDTSEQIISHVRAAIDNPGVTIAPYGSSDSEPSAVSSTDAAGYKMLERTIRQVFPETLVVPAQVLGGTDLRHYAGLAEQVSTASARCAWSPTTWRAITASTSGYRSKTMRWIVRFYYQSCSATATNRTRINE